MEIIRILVNLTGLVVLILAFWKESARLLVAATLLFITWTLLHIWTETGSPYGATIGLIYCVLLSFASEAIKRDDV